MPTSLLAVSEEQSEKEAVSALGLSEDVLVTVYPSADPIFGIRSLSRDREAALRSRYRITRPFIFNVGVSEPRKNHPALLEAYARLPQSLRRAYQLVIAGEFRPSAVERAVSLVGAVGSLRSRPRHDGQSYG